MRLYAMFFAGAFAIVVSPLCQQAVVAQESNLEFQSHLKGGEFGLVQQAARQVETIPRRDAILAQVSSAQFSAGEQIAAARTDREIQSGGRGDGVVNGAGGGAFADFDSLIQLIQQTVVPDTWEALGGPSTIAPYPQGVYVDPNGTLQECETVASSDALNGLASLLKSKTSGGKQAGNPIGGQTWRSASKLRVVSLRRLKDQLRERGFFGRDATEAMLHMAGLSQIQYIMIQENDILLAGPVGGIDSVDGWYRDRATGLNTLRSDFFFTCLSSVMKHQPFGCTIDPTPQGMQQAALVAQAIQADKIPIGKAAQKMEEALGLQRVEVFGTAGDTPIGYVMVEADRHMKQLALGKVDMPAGVKNYLDVIDDTIAQGSPDKLLLRLWFTAAPRSVRADNDRKVFELSGTPIQLSGQNQRAQADGGRGEVVVDFRSEAFVKGFNDHWGEIRAKYPIYSALESIYRVASVSQLVNKFADDDIHRSLLQTLAAESSGSPWIMPTPRQVQSIATHHRVRHGRKIHHVVVASGGVSVNANQTVATKLVSYPSLKSVSSHAKSQPKLVQRWWWDAK